LAASFIAAFSASEKVPSLVFVRLLVVVVSLTGSSLQSMCDPIVVITLTEHVAEM
jgi:hypothetical protein